MATKDIFVPLSAIFGLVALSKAAGAHEKDSHSPSSYVKVNLPYARSTETMYRVPALFSLAQAGLESKWGTSKIARNANNHFGIKVSPGWKGDRYGDYRKYNSAQGSYEDHAKFLTLNDRYDAAFNYTDPFTFANAVAAAGYANDPAYATKIKTAMELVKQII